MNKEDLQAISELLYKKLNPVLTNQDRIEKKLDAVVNQTAALTEFRTEKNILRVVLT